MAGLVPRLAGGQPRRNAAAAEGIGYALSTPPNPPFARGGKGRAGLVRLPETMACSSLFVVINCGPCAPFIGGCLASLKKSQTYSN